MLVPQAPRLRRQKPRPPTETSSTTVTNKPAEPEADKEKSSLDVEGEVLNHSGRAPGDA